MALIKSAKAENAALNLDLVIDDTSATGDYTFQDDCEVLIINTQLAATNIKIDGVDITTTTISSADFKYTGSTTYKYVGHIAAGSVLSMTTSNFSARLYMVTT